MNYLYLTRDHFITLSDPKNPGIVTIGWFVLAYSNYSWIFGIFFSCLVYTKSDVEWQFAWNGNCRMGLLMRLEVGLACYLCRLHVVSEFDGEKRSCRRTLAERRERRRKSSQDSVSRNASEGMYVMSFQLTCFCSSLKKKNNQFCLALPFFLGNSISIVGIRWWLAFFPKNCQE